MALEKEKTKKTEDINPYASNTNEKGLLRQALFIFANVTKSPKS